MRPSIATEYEFVEVGLQVLCPQTMADADLPRSKHHGVQSFANRLDGQILQQKFLST